MKQMQQHMVVDMCADTLHLLLSTKVQPLGLCPADLVRLAFELVSNSHSHPLLTYSL